MKTPYLSVIIPLFNEAEGFAAVFERLDKTLSSGHSVVMEYILVNDGSTDGTGDLLAERAARDARITVITLLRNMGHQQALMAGLRAARGEAFLMMDGDGQHPATVASQMLENWLNAKNLDMVQGVRRGGQHGFKEAAAQGFYRLARSLMPEIRIEPGASDFRIIGRRVRDIMLAHPVCSRNIRIFLSQYAFRTNRIAYDCAARQAGKSKYSLRKMLRLAFNGIFSFTHLPLRINLAISFFLMAFGLAFLIYSLAVKSMGHTVSGWPSLVGLVCMLFSGVFAMLAIISEYIILIHEGVEQTLSELAQRRGHEDSP
ncbi:MAG: glycosyltransferase family 2 protein, partial [Kiritimatiellia bacterium]|nr:glycosyltransferase family 2 protein [Kiritimatiellia bacterium]